MPSKELEALVSRMHAEDRERGYRMAPRAKPSADEGRQMAAIMDQIALPIPKSISTRSETIGGVMGRWFEPADSDSSRVILYFHGGGYMFGTSLNTGHVTARLAAATGVYAFSVDYRLSLEAPFPAAVDDAVAVYRGLLAKGFQSRNIAFAGDSAGGGLVVAAKIALREQGEPLPAAGFLSSPWTDLAMTGDSIRENEETDVICTTLGLQIMAEAYLGEADPRTPLASPLYADLAGLPPLLIQAGGNEQLRDDGIRLAERAKAAGVDVTLEVVDGGVHIWQYVGPDLPETKKSEAQAGAFLARHLGK